MEDIASRDNMTMHLELYQVRRTLIILKDEYIKKYNDIQPTRIQSEDKAMILKSLTLSIDLVEDEMCKVCNQCVDKTKCDDKRGKL